MTPCWFLHRWQHRQQWTPPEHYGKIVTQFKAWDFCVRCGKVRNRVEFKYDPITGDSMQEHA